jgi:hypothetical protein
LRVARRVERKEKREEELGRKLRGRFPRALPAPPDPDGEVEVPYAKRYERDFDAGEAVAWLIARPEWEQTIGAECDAVEAERPKRGPTPSYTTRELETALFYQVMRGIRTWKAARKELAGDTGLRTRQALGFDVERPTRCPQDVKRLVGVPSESTMCRHRQRFPWERRLGAYRAYFDLLRQLNARDPELRDGLRILGIDGTAQPTSLTCPKVNPATGEIVNADRVTCATGGYRVKDTEKVHGFAAVPLHCVNGLPWSYAHGPVQMDERDAAVRAVEDFRDNVLPHTGPRRLSVLTADTNFHDQTRLRPLLHGLGLVPNIHHISHAEDRLTTEAEKTVASRLQFDLHGKPGWYVDGFREPHHRCGDVEHPVHVYRRVEQLGERAVVRIEAECKHCDTSVTITAGQWKKVRDTSRDKNDERGQQKFMPVHPTDPDDVREWDLGNPLSYHDELAARYGDMRFGHGEGFNGAAVKRFKLFKTKGYYWNDVQAELHCVMVFCAMHGLTQRRRELEAAGQFDHADDRPKRRGWSKKLAVAA